MALLYQPQLAKSVLSISALPKGGDYVIEPKFDGWRMIVHIHGFTVDFYTRTGEHHSGDRFPVIQEELLSAYPGDTWLDGELVYLNPEEEADRCNWAKVQNYAGSKDRVDEYGELSYAVFDILCMDGNDARFIKFSQRRELVTKSLEQTHCNNVFYPAQFPALQEVHDKLVEAGWEGSIVKDNYARYASGKRGYGQWKLKGVWTTEGIIMDFQEGKNSFTGMVGAIIFGQLNSICPSCEHQGEFIPGPLSHFKCECGSEWEADLVKRGKCSGFDMELRQAMTDDPDSYKNRIIEVQHNGVMPSGGLRHPQFLRFRTDKPYGEIVWSEK